MADLSPRQVAEIIGLSRSAIYRAIVTGELDAYKVRGRLRVEPAALQRWKEENRVCRRADGPAYEPRPYTPSRADSTANGFASDLKAIGEGGQA